jgi:hypothetical protein
MFLNGLALCANIVWLYWLTHLNLLIASISYLKVKDGDDDVENLACACGGCNGSKYNKTHAADPFDGTIVPLFHPRKMSWYDHFIWSPDFLYVIGITEIGRTTVEALYLNRIGLVNFRRALLKLGIHPPK